VTKENRIKGTPTEDYTWCYWCDNLRSECVCASDPNGIPQDHWSKIVPPTCEQIWNEELGNPVQHHDDASWRHGSYRTEVYLRQSDNTYWSANYRVSTDCETNELREGFAKISQVRPETVSSTVYVEVAK
jgi:hypothetical protein